MNCASLERSLAPRAVDASRATAYFLEVPVPANVRSLNSFEPAQSSLALDEMHGIHKKKRNVHEPRPGFQKKSGTMRNELCPSEDAAHRGGVRMKSCKTS